MTREIVMAGVVVLAVLFIFVLVVSIGAEAGGDRRTSAKGYGCTRLLPILMGAGLLVYGVSAPQMEGALLIGGILLAVGLYGGGPRV